MNHFFGTPYLKKNKKQYKGKKLVKREVKTIISHIYVGLYKKLHKGISWTIFLTGT